MAKQTDGSFDPRTWLQPGPARAAGETAAGPAEGTAKAAGMAPSSAQDPGFNPRTWVMPGDPAAPSNSDAGHDSTAKAPPATGTTAAARRPAVLGGAALAVLLAGGAAVWLANGSDEEGEPLDSPTDAARAPAATLAGDDAELRILQVAGMAGFVQAMLDLGVAGDEALTLAREASAALGETSDDIRLEVRIDRGRSSNEATFITSLAATLASGQGVRIVRAPSGSGFERENSFVEARRQIRRAEGEMGLETFYIAGVAAGVPDSLITGFAKVFSFDFDFQRDVDVGDRFEAVWEEQIGSDGRAAAPPQLIYAAMTTKKGRREYYAFTPPDEVAERFFDAAGQGNERGLMRTPVDGARVSSRFGYRTHPITQTVKQHGGVDFAAPIGTPIYASGDAVVTLRQMAGGAGNMIRLDHGKDLMTVYMHLSRFADDLAVGKNVRQGEVIGYVGNTGASTGPHLHYEIHVSGVKQDPLEFETSQVEPLKADALRMYRQRKQEIDALRAR